MSIPVALSTLADAIARYRFAYLLTSSDAGAPHAVAVTPMLKGGALVIDGLGRRTRSNAAQRPAVALVWPPGNEGDYSLIVDGQASLDGEILSVEPTRAVLHRPAPAGAEAAPGHCGADCVELGTGAPGGTT